MNVLSQRNFNGKSVKEIILQEATFSKMACKDLCFVPLLSKTIVPPVVTPFVAQINAFNQMLNQQVLSPLQQQKLIQSVLQQNQ